MAIPKYEGLLIKPLTKKQRQILSYIVHYLNSKRYCPLSKEINSACFTGNSPSQFLLALEIKGFIKRASGKSRGIEILDPTYDELEKQDIAMWVERDSIASAEDLKKWRNKYEL